MSVERPIENVCRPPASPSLSAGMPTKPLPESILRRKTRPENLEELVEGLHELFSDEMVDIDLVTSWMESYPGLKSDWKKFEKVDKYRYTRNLVDAGNGKFNLILMSWGEGMGSGIHDHADSHCFMKILDGELKETLYDWPDETKDEEVPVEADETKLRKKGTTIYEFPKVAYINDSIGLHRVENNSDASRAVSLHVYSPPFDTCRCFDERSGKANSISITFYSKFGKRTHGEVRSAVRQRENN